MNKIRHTKDATLERNNIQYGPFLIKEYNLTKAKKHPSYKFLHDFYKAHGIQRQNFIKYYNRYRRHNDNNALLPLKRGPRYKTRSTPQWIENKIIALRKLGANRYQIHSMLKEACKDFTPAPSTIYGMLRRNNLNRLKLPMKRERRKIIKEKAGELGELDCHYLAQGLIEGSSKGYYLVGLIDSLCVFQGDAFDKALPQAHQRATEAYEQDKMGWRTWLSVITMLFQKLVDSFSKVLGLLSHGGAVALMHYVKAVSLLVVVQFGPLAALFSLLPGPFKRSFSVWSKSYVNITCWTITLNIFWVLSKTFSTASLIKAGGIGAPFGETLGYTCLSIVLFVAIFLTPTWTSKFIGGVLVPNMTTGLSLAAGKVGKLAQLSKR